MTAHTYIHISAALQQDTPHTHMSCKASADPAAILEFAKEQDRFVHNMRRHTST